MIFRSGAGFIYKSHARTSDLAVAIGDTTPADDKPAEKVWSLPTPTRFANPNSKAAIIATGVDASRRLLLVHNPSQDCRGTLALAVSADDGASWSEGPAIEEEPVGSIVAHCAPTLAEMGDGVRIGYTTLGQGIRVATLMQAFQDMATFAGVSLGRYTMEGTDDELIAWVQPQASARQAAAIVDTVAAVTGDGHGDEKDVKSDAQTAPAIETEYEHAMAEYNEERNRITSDDDFKTMLQTERQRLGGLSMKVDEFLRGFQEEQAELIEECGRYGIDCD